MSYAKLFGSILDSSIWQESKETKLLWITMLAMKDQDGIVSASIPGLAKRAGLTIQETLDSLAVLLAPDPWSRTPAFDGRRIEVVPGGWRVINHDEYRDREDADDRRQKDADRKARYRARKAGLSHDVPDCPAMSHDVPTSDAETESFRNRPREGSGSGPASSQPPDPDRGGGRDHVHGEPLPDRVLRPMVDQIERHIGETRQTLASELGLPPPLWVHPTNQDRMDAMARLRESGPEPMRYFDQVWAMATEAARVSGSLEYLNWCVFRDKAWGRKLSQTAQDVRRKDAQPVDHFDAVDRALAARRKP